MWKCPACARIFSKDNQSHMCQGEPTDVWDLFEGKSDEVLLAFDSLMSSVLQWEPCVVGAAKHSAVFTNRRAWLIVKPMSKVIDIKFYMDRALQDPTLHKVNTLGNRYVHHIRVASEDELTPEVFDLLRLAYDWAFEQG